jgi:hypothetical protein
MAEFNAFTPRESPELPSDPFPPTIVIINGSEYEYARRVGTLEDPVDVDSLGTGKLAILGIQTNPFFHKSIDINCGISAIINKYITVHSEPYLYIDQASGINTSVLQNAWHFRADPFLSVGTSVGFGETIGIGTEFGFAFYNPKNIGITSVGLSTITYNSFGFYYGETPEQLPISGGYWGVYIDDAVSNYFEGKVLIGTLTNSGEKLKVEGTTTLNGATTIGGATSITGATTITGATLIQDTTQSTSKITGALIVSGGVGIEKNTYIGGNLEITGALSKGSGTFDIVHPLEENKRLRHSFVEGPRYDNIYRNKVRLINGKAKVNLDLDCVSPGGQTMTPGTWEKLNRNPDIFLQNLEGWDRLRGKINGSILEIECENLNCNDMISWMVVAERQDDLIMNCNMSDNEGRLILEYVS